MDSKFVHVVNKDSDQTARMRRLILIFVARPFKKVRFLTFMAQYFFFKFTASFKCTLRPLVRRKCIPI